MSKLDEIEWKCSCGHTQQSQLWTSINVQFNPELKGNFLNGELNSVSCEKCGKNVRMSMDILYSDMEKELMVQLIHDDDERKARVSNEMEQMFQNVIGNRTLRKVSSELEMIEKIAIADDGLDDRVIEVLKLIVLNNQKIFDVDMNKLIYSKISGRSSGDQVLLFRESSSESIVPIKMCSYQATKDHCFGNNFFPSEGEWLEVEEDFARPIAEELIDMFENPVRRKFLEAQEAVRNDDIEGGILILSSLAKDGNLDAQDRVAILYKGLKTEEGNTEAFRWWAKAAKSGHPEALRHLGSAFIMRIGTERSCENASECFYRAGVLLNESGDIDGAYDCLDKIESMQEWFDYINAPLYLKLYGLLNKTESIDTNIACPVCKTGSIQLNKYRDLSEDYSCSNVPDCMLIVDGEIIHSPCPKCDFPLINKTTHWKDGVNQHCLSDDCDYSNKIEAVDIEGIKNKFEVGKQAHIDGDYQKAIEVLVYLANHYNYSEAQNYLGCLFYDGVGVSHDDRSAVYWFKQGVEQDFPKAMYNLAKMYGEGRVDGGVNHGKAKELFRTALNLGVEQARDLIDNYESYFES